MFFLIAYEAVHLRRYKHILLNTRKVFLRIFKISNFLFSPPLKTISRKMSTSNTSISRA